MAYWKMSPERIFILKEKARPFRDTAISSMEYRKCQRTWISQKGNTWNNQCWQECDRKGALIRG